MTGIRSKRPRVKLGFEAYRQLCREVLERDGWRCQSCGRTDSLQVHHIQSRSRLGDDAAENLIALCASCHQKACPSALFFFKATRGVRLQRNQFSSYDHAYLEDGSIYARWDGVESSSSQWMAAALPAVVLIRHGESFQVYLLGQALSFALVKIGLEPLHATCVVVGGAAVVLLGDSGFGKSSLAACFLSAGYTLLTDDLLLLRESPKGLLAYPGPPRIKLFPAMARRFLGRKVKSLPMNSDAQKLVIPLDRDRICSTPVPVRAIYALVSPHDVSGIAEVRIAPLSSRKAFVTLLNNTFNYVIVDADRLRRQFLETTSLVNTVKVRSLAYPRRVSSLTSVRDTLLADLTRNELEAPVGRYIAMVASEPKR